MHKVLFVTFICIVITIAPVRTANADCTQDVDRTWKYENEGALWQVMLHENRREIVEAMKHFAHFKKQLEVKPNEVSAYLGETGTKAKARIQKTMQRMVESRDLINGSVYGTYKIFTHLPVKEDLASTENEVIN